MFKDFTTGTGQVEANQSALFACSIRYILCDTGPCHAATIRYELIYFIELVSRENVQVCVTAG